MNKIIIIAVFIFWLAVSFFYANSLLKQNNPASKNTNQATNLNNNQKGTLATDLPTHNNKADCWIAIDNKIYNVTDYLYQHPGGAEIMVKYCGQDASQAFASKDKFIPQDHSSTAYAMLASYYIGDLNNPPTINPGAPNNTNSAKIDKTTTNNTPLVTYTLTTAIVTQHNTALDCWVTANNNVYNITSYIKSHPGGQANIIRYCGADIAAAYTAQGHSANANNIFASYKIGTIGSTVSSNTTPPSNTNQNSDGGDDEEEDD